MALPEGVAALSSRGDPAARRPVETVETGCSHCGSEGTDPLWSGSEHEYANTTEQEFTFIRCASCGLVRLHPRPTVGELGQIYPPNYYAYNLSVPARTDELPRTELAKQRMYQQRFAELVGRLGPRDGPIRVLDVGCADGRLLDWYRSSEVGDRIETHGIEMSEHAAAAARAKGHRVVSGRFEVDRELEEGRFDLILAAHVIEHVDDPRAFAERAAELLAPGGLLQIATPNWDSADARRLRGRWGGNHFPRHWTLYDERTLGTLAEEIGLDLERIDYQPNPIFWVWSCHSLLSHRFPRANWPHRVFPPVGIFRPSLQSFLLLGLFTVVDLVQRAITGRTASIAVEMRRTRES